MRAERLISDTSGSLHKFDKSILMLFRSQNHAAKPIAAAVKLLNEQGAI
jgi:hypothetical protein